MDCKVIEDSEYVNRKNGKLRVRRTEINVIINEGKDSKKQYVLKEYEDYCYDERLKLGSLFDPYEGNVYLSVEGSLPRCTDFSLEEALDLPSPVKFLKMEGETLKLYKLLRDKFSGYFDGRF